MMELKATKLWTAMVTPMREDGTLDFESFGSLLREQEAAGNGVLILGSTGEALAMTEAEKQAVIDFTCGQGLQVPVMVGLGGSQLPQQQEFLQGLATKAVQAVLAPVPLYAKPGAMGQTTWFESILAATDKPVMLYNVPSRTGVKLHPAVLPAIKDSGNLWAVKEASGSIDEFAAYRASAPDLQFFSGDDALTPYFALNGAAGLVSVAANVWPRATALFVERCLQQRLGDAIAMWTRASQALFSAANPVPAKALLTVQQRIRSGAVRAPLSVADLPRTDELQAVHELVTAWYDANA